MLWRKKLALALADFIIFIVVASTFIITALIEIKLGPQEIWIFSHDLGMMVIATVILAVLFALFVMLGNWLNSMVRVHALACTLNKLSIQFKLVSSTDKKDILRNIRYVRSFSAFETTQTNKYLFKKEHKIEDSFYDKLTILADFLNDSLNNQNRSNTISQQLEKLALAIFDDRPQKIALLNDVLSGYTKKKEEKKKKIRIRFKGLLSQKWVLVILWIVVLIIAGIFSFKIFGIEKNTAFIGFIGLLGVIVLVIYKK